jgi:tRNA (cmo5U34)-methyltransferase
MSVEQAFNQSAGYYDSWVRKALPGFDDLFSSALRALPFPENASVRVLDLGAGTGLFSSLVLEKFPQARFTLVDLAEGMLAVARERFQAAAAQFTYSVADIRSIQFDAEFDLVISSLAIHHLEHTEKQALFRRIHTALRSPGLFLNIDQIQAPTLEMHEHYWTVWLEHVRAQGASEEQIQRSIDRRQTYDRDASLHDQLAWLQEAGFVAVDILYKHHFIGLFYAQKE